MAEQYTGNVKFFRTDKGYGFIAPESGGDDHFVHITDLKESGIDLLLEGHVVSYSVEADQDGRDRAVDLEILDHVEPPKPKPKKKSRSKASKPKKSKPEATLIEMSVTARVKWFDHEKGYGFFKPCVDGDNRDIFIHIKTIQQSGLGHLQFKPEDRFEISVFENQQGLVAGDLVFVGYGEESNVIPINQAS